MESYPIHDAGYRSTLNDNIYNYYQYYQISLANDSKWLYMLAARMAVIMPKYNLLYKSLDYLKDIDPLLTFDTTRDVEHSGSNAHSKDIATDESTHISQDMGRTGSGSQTSDNNTSGQYETNVIDNNDNTHRETYSDTPQGNLATPPDTTTMSYYATNANYGSVKDEGTTDTSNTHSDTSHATGSNSYSENTDSTGTGTLDRDVKEGYESSDEYEDHVHEYGTAPGSNYSDLLQKYRDLARNIDMEIIAELDDLFATTWSPSYYTEGYDRLPYPNFI